jgi:hypothetical protein
MEGAEPERCRLAHEVAEGRMSQVLSMPLVLRWAGGRHEKEVFEWEKRARGGRGREGGEAKGGGEREGRRGKKD